MARAETPQDQLRAVADAARELSGAERCALALFENGKPKVVVGDESLAPAIAAAAAGSPPPADTLTLPFGSRRDWRGALILHPVPDGATAPLLVPLVHLAMLAAAVGRLSDRERDARAEVEKAAQAARDLEARALRAEREKETEIAEAARALELSRRELQSKYNYANIVGRSEAMRELFLLLDKVTDTQVPILISGESGTGKELVAKAIHFNGSRRAAAFLSINCAAFPETLLEAELFGYMRGSFTGADRDKVGLFEAADKGTLFLDEVGEMSPGMQAKLLRVLQEGEVRPVGGKQNKRVDVRIISASNQDLRKMIEAGRFRMDLFYRLNVISVSLPALRDRREDIPLLVEHFVRRDTPAGKAAKAIGAGVLESLCAYHWPGNVRELENEVRRALTLSAAEVTPGDLSPHIKRATVERYDIGHPDGLTLKARLEILERRILKEALQRANGNKTRCAEELGLSRFGFLKKLDKYGLR